MKRNKLKTFQRKSLVMKMSKISMISLPNKPKKSRSLKLLNQNSKKPNIL